ncbi:MAG TPA: Xaa-Pro peptidase family protein [Bauldia sp.]|nr:Xaa-Pro peptidase family protein [Bauldia sp.]
MLTPGDHAARAAAVRERFFRIAAEIDLVVTTNTVHVGYLTGYRSILLDADRYYRMAAVVTRDKVILVTGGSDAAAALEVLGDPASIYRYGEFYVAAHAPGTGYEAMPPAAPSFEEALGKALRSVLVASMRVGVDCPDPAIRDLVGTVSGSTTSATPLLVESRSVKLPAEIELLRFASQVAESGMQKAFAAAGVGVSELELATIITSTIIAHGGIPRFTVVTSGERTALVDAYATHRKLKAGDLLRIDVGCTFGGYWADNARTAVIGEPSALQATRYRALQAGEQAQLDAVRPGVTADHLYRLGVDVTRENGFPAFNRNHCGHGIGVVAHEYPSLNAAHAGVAIEQGMVLCVETPYYETGWGGMMVEDTVLVTETGCTPFTVADRTLRVI